ncbi:MAG: B12-binding domain-containing radical SAM protein [Promethearchaeota archaeon]
MNLLIIDCLAVGGGNRRKFSRDFIGGGPKLIAGILNKLYFNELYIKIIRAEDILLKKINFDSFNLCLISAMSIDIECVRKIIKIWRKTKKREIIIIGGPITNDLNILSVLNADIAVIHEGEKKIESIINILIQNELKFNDKCVNNLKKIKGIYIRYNYKIFKTELAPFLTKNEFNLYSNPKYFINYLKDYENYKSARIYVECLRGCSNYYRIKFTLEGGKRCKESCNNCNESNLYKRISCPMNIPPGCGFCSTISFFGPPKSRDSKLILSEIKGLLELGAKRIVLGGPDLLDYKREDLTDYSILSTPKIPPTPNYEALEGLIDQIIKLKPIKERNAQIFVENIKASLCTDRALRILSKIPNCTLSIGCETGSSEFAIKLGRPFSPSDTLQAVKKGVKLGIRFHIYLIHSLPGEKVKYLSNSIKIIDEFFKLGAEKITIYKFQDFPGAPFHYLQNKRRLLYQTDKKLNSYRKKLVKAAINFNLKKKEEMIGNIYEVILAENSFLNKDDIIAYIVKGGPKVLIRNAANYIGTMAKVKINRVISDKLIEGFIV